MSLQGNVVYACRLQLIVQNDSSRMNNVERVIAEPVASKVFLDCACTCSQSHGRVHVAAVWPRTEALGVWDHTPDSKLFLCGLQKLHPLNKFAFRTMWKGRGARRSVWQWSDRRLSYGICALMSMKTTERGGTTVRQTLLSTGRLEWAAHMSLSARPNMTFGKRFLHTRRSERNNGHACADRRVGVYFMQASVFFVFKRGAGLISSPTGTSLPHLGMKPEYLIVQPRHPVLYMDRS